MTLRFSSPNKDQTSKQLYSLFSRLFCNSWLEVFTISNKFSRIPSSGKISTTCSVFFILSITFSSSALNQGSTSSVLARKSSLYSSTAFVTTIEKAEIKVKEMTSKAEIIFIPFSFLFTLAFAFARKFTFVNFIAKLLLCILSIQ